VGERRVPSVDDEASKIELLLASTLGRNRARRDCCGFALDSNHQVESTEQECKITSPDMAAALTLNYVQPENGHVKNW